MSTGISRWREPVLREQLNQLHQAIPGTLLAVIIVGSLLFVFLRQVAGEQMALWWYSTLWLVMVLRLFDWWVYRKTSGSASLNAAFWRFFTGAILTALLWMTSVFLFYAPELPLEGAFLIMALAGVSAGSVATLSYVRSVAISYVLVILIPLAMLLLLSESQHSFYFGLMVVMFIVFLLNAINVFYRNNCLNIQLRNNAIEDEKNLRDQQNRYRLIFDNAPLGIIYFRRDGRVLSANYEAMHILAMDRTELETYNLLANPQAAIARVIEEAFSHGSASHEGQAGELCGQSSVPVKIFFAVVAGDEQEIGGIAIIEDISSAKKIDRLKNEFVSTVSHELRTPLTAIIGGLSILENRQHDAEDAQIIEIARRNSENLLKIINDILDMDRIEIGELHFELQTWTLLPLVRKTISDNEVLARKKDIPIQLDCADEKLQVLVDNARFRQAMTNLLVNAIKFSPRHEPVQLNIEASADRVRISVIDQGPGVSNEFSERIFQKFSRDDGSDTRRYGGAGLGLYITKMIVEKMSGTVGFYNKQEGGAVFYMELPLEARTA